MFAEDPLWLSGSFCMGRELRIEASGTLNMEAGKCSGHKKVPHFCETLLSDRVRIQT